MCGDVMLISKGDGRDKRVGLRERVERWRERETKRERERE